MNHQERDYLDSIIAERDEAQEALQSLAQDHYFARAEAAEAENVQLLKRLAFFTDGDQTITVGRKFLKDLEWAATAAEARVTELREALALAQTAIGFAIAEKNSLSLTEMRMLQPRIDAALAKEDTA